MYVNLQIITVPFCQLRNATRFSAAITTAVILILERMRNKEEGTARERENE
jgi:hypothetical protein